MSRHVLLVGPKSSVWTSPELLPLGLAYLAAMLERAGHTVRIYDAVAEDEPLEAVLDQASSAGRPYDLVGVTAVTPLIKEAWAVAALAKQQGAVTVLGGPHPTILPDESLARPEVDLVVRGEGEEAIVEIAEALGRLVVPPAAAGEGQRPLSSIGNLSYKTPDGQIVHNPARPLRKDLDSLPFPAHHLFQVERYSNLQPLTDGQQKKPRAFTIMTSRGCPYSCIYCSKAIEGKVWRPRSTASVVAEWRWLTEDMRATEIGVADDVFNIRLDRAKDICRALIAGGLTRVPWVTIHGIRADHTDLELFQLMKWSGCRRVGFGVESGNQRVLDGLKKHQTIDDVRTAFRLAKQAGLQTMGFFMFGLPGENEAAMDDTIRLALELDPDMANFMITSPFPGTELYDLVLREGRLFSNDWADFAIHEDHARYEIGEVTAELVVRKWHEAYRRFYLRPGRLARQALQPDTWRRLPTYLTNARRFFLSRAGAAA
jgi:anaerobic magnesium-protoporphyrin IX monomethyl ester cyclase